MNSSLSTVHSLAFTLAETLIVMGIIGVVAALTIPNASKNTNNAEKVARFKKIYAELNEAQDRATAVYGPIETWNNSSGPSRRYIDRITEFMKIAKTCDTYNTSSVQVECMTNYKKHKLYNTTQTDSSEDTLSVILANGASLGVFMNRTNNKCPGKYKSDNAQNYREIVCGYINLDIDGPKKGKNTYGIDIFKLSITKDGIKPCGKNATEGYSAEYFVSTNMDYITHDGRCAGQWIMDFGNMDYLMVKKRDSVDDSRTCPNTKKLGYDTAAGDVQSCK